MSDFLDEMVAGSERRAAALRGERSVHERRRAAEAAPPPPPLKLGPEGFDLIAEIKLSSPSAGKLAPPAADIGARAAAYARAGACAVSVLTEPSRFGGDLEHLRMAAGELDGMPAMAKDFLTDPCQVCAARVAGAGGVLLILRILDDARLVELLTLARDLGMFVLVEAFDRADLERADGLLDSDLAGSPPILLGLNTRDLRTLAVAPGRLEALAEAMPAGFPAVAESGLASPADVAAAARSGYSVGLVGTALMRTDHPGVTLAAMLQAGREAAR